MQRRREVVGNEIKSLAKTGLDIDRHIALDAGAGTGKTTVMAHRYVQHICLKTKEQHACFLLQPECQSKGWVQYVVLLEKELRLRIGKAFYQRKRLQ